MPVSLDKMMQGLPAERRERIEREAEKIITENRTLAALRKQLGMTQDELADALETSQSNVAQIERKNDLMLSTVRRVVAALGGELFVLAKIPGHGTVSLTIDQEGATIGIAKQPRHRIPSQKDRKVTTTDIDGHSARSNREEGEQVVRRRTARTKKRRHRAKAA